MDKDTSYYDRQLPKQNRQKYKLPGQIDRPKQSRQRYKLLRKIDRQIDTSYKIDKRTDTKQTKIGRQNETKQKKIQATRIYGQTKAKQTKMQVTVQKKIDRQTKRFISSRLFLKCRLGTTQDDKKL